MSSTIASQSALPFVDSVFHPTDFSESSELAFAHALAIALVRQTRLDILHAGDAPDRDWHRFPRVRQNLERWGLLEPGSDRSAVFDELAVRVQKIHMSGNPVAVCLEHIQTRSPDLVVLATEGREGLASWLDPSPAATVQRRSGTMTLVVPAGCRGFVSPETGSLDLDRILLPVDASPDASDAVTRATRAAKTLGNPPVEIELFHVGDGPAPEVERPDGEAWSWRETTVQGEVVDEIVRAGRSASLIVMPTDGRDGIFDVFRGSVTERVARRADCPVLAVPCE